MVSDAKHHEADFRARQSRSGGFSHRSWGGQGEHGVRVVEIPTGG